MWWEPDSHVALSLNRVLSPTIFQFVHSLPKLASISRVFNFRLTGSFQFYFQTYSLVTFRLLLPGSSLYMSDTIGALPVPAAPVQTHPLERLSLDFDYERVRCQLINPFLAQLRYMSLNQTELSGLPISHAETRTSFESLRQLILDTDINRSDAPYFLPSNNIVVGNHSATIPLDREFEISGELCPLQLSWYVTPSWKFEVGGLVRLRNENNRLLRVKKICGVGKDFVVFSVKEHGPLDPQYVKISRLIAPFFSFYNLPFRQRMIYRFFFKQLKTVAEIMGIVELGRSKSSDATMEMDGSPLTTSSEILGAV